MWEEAGVKVWSVKYHSSQPWVSSHHLFASMQVHELILHQPYPANLMVGCYARADASQPLRIDLDNELEGASLFFSRLARIICVQCTCR